MVSVKLNSNEHNQLSQLVIDKVEESYLKAETLLKRSFARPQISLKLRGKSAGTATPQKNLLRFNPILLKNNQSDFLNQTIPHEVAHLIAYELFGPRIKPHGLQWQQIMTQIFQLEPHRCHNYSIEKKTKKYFIYQCHCTDLPHTFTTRRHNLSLNGAKYLCKKCRKLLTFTGKYRIQ